MVGGFLEVTQQPFGIIGWKEERPTLLPFALGGKEGEETKGRLILRFNHVLFEMAGEDEDLVPHLLKDFDPLFRLQADAVNVPDTTDDQSDFHLVNLPLSDWNRNVGRD